ncbi:spore germination protein [Paenibacillus typhae]|uniref:spore germination protein n=1 Tax=Paenibacillus typhae TaxID=1174501 RepID=UPI001C8D97AF|nr:spore germination protein [Paenibacillus typhae]MBY0011230.1 spore germination protein [Paenibacillus typhae]
MFKTKKKTLNKKQNVDPAVQQPETNSQPQKLYKDLSQNEKQLRSIYANCSDLVYRSFLIENQTKAILIYIDGLADTNGLEINVITPLIQVTDGKLQDLEQLAERKIPAASAKPFTTFQECVDYLSSGLPILLRDQDATGLAFGLNKWEKRSIEEPVAESAIRGPREGFTETLRTNTSLIRRIVKSPSLKTDQMKIGDFTQTKVVIAYIEGLVDETLVTEVKNRLGRIRIDGILESGYIEEMIEDNFYSPFPQLLTTERPDVVCGNLLEGRVAIMVEGSPSVLVAPITFFSLMQAAEDYYQRFWISTAMRWLRYSFTLISLLLPSLYVAILTFHQEMVPGKLLISMATSREAVPFPALIEALLMEVTFEALREAGVRLPKQIGSAVSIVGALVIGQAAVQAGLVSAPMVIVVAITGISSFMIPRYIAGIAIRLLRFPLIFLAGSFGLLGVMMGIIAIVIHLCSLRSFGVPYLSVIATPKPKELKDVLVRAPWWMMNTRPRLTGKYNQYRQAPDQKPGPERGGEA